VLGFQGRSQLETRYGHEAEAMLSQPATKIFLRTSEPNAAKWISDAIGKMEIERLRESRSSGQMGGQRNTTSYNNERDVVPLVMDSEISGLENLHGYLKSGNLVVRISFPVVELPAKHSRFIQRPAEIRPEEPPKAATAAAGAGGGPEQKHTQQEINQDHEQELKRSSTWQGHFFR
jgi:type IV secretory pathway TraG/TraD family ATPase VirD4